ncbi:serine/threonine-protein kinase [Thermococcus peptonophilus]|uniref:Serine/threonine protein kinase n=1 Tax=Thermococcus peptonophilus TaxID=53952 RepID=A0A142CXX3_9EURY|nr:serine/threonine-protein kinase [Thermococcus peptonophilus]AMQ19625.1 serine/threonine protein kinase [Thermococcus peptonophilus]
MGHMFDDDILEGIIKLFIVIVIISVIFGRFAWFFIFIVIFMWGGHLVRHLLRDITKPRKKYRYRYPKPTPPAPPVPREDMRELLRKSVIVELPPKVHAGEEIPLTVGFRNLLRGTINVEIDLSDLSRYFDLSSTRVYFRSVKPGEYVSQSVRVVPRRPGKVSAKVVARSGIVSAKVKVSTEIIERPKVEPKTPLPVPVPAQGGSKNSAEGPRTPLEELFARYKNVELIGEGGFARVYRAERKDGSVVALKIPMSLTEAGGKAFLREVRNWSLLSHPNIVELYDYNIFPVPYLEMEYCESSLAKLEKPLNPEKAARIIFDVAEGIKYAHSKGIIHRDLKPSNILLKNGRAKVSDWGLSKLLKESRTTQSVSFTPLYAAPEQISSRFGGTDERTDVWQIGAVLYELLTGRPPFEGEDFVEVASKITLEEPVPPSHLNPEAKPLEHVVMKCLAKKKEERYGSVEELQRDIAEFLGTSYREKLSRSVSVRDLSRSAYFAGELFLLYLKLNDLVNALKYADDLIHYARGETKRELVKLQEQLKLRLENGLEVPEELIEKAEIIVHRIKLGFKGV